MNVRNSTTQRTRRMPWWRNLVAVIATLSFFGVAQAQVSTNGGSGLSASYPDLAGAITALNAATINSPVVITVNASSPQTAPAGGYSITASGTAANTITIQGGGNTVTASAALTAGSLNDAIFKIVGGDYITIESFTMNENAGNTTITAASNNMTEWGVALLYATTTNGAQNCTVQNNTIALNRTYQNTFGIYANSTHTDAAPLTSATATGAGGGNSGLKIYGNNISNVNNGILVVGPTAAADQNNGVDIGGASGATANTLTNFGTTGTFSAFANVNASVFGILVRNAVNVNISFNSITSSAGGTTSGALRGIYLPSYSNAPSGTPTHNINSNVISLQSGVAAGTLGGIQVDATTGNAGATQNINNNNFTQLNYSVAASGAPAAISIAMANLVNNVTGNTFTNLSTSTTGGFTFIAHPYAMASGQTMNFNNNSIVTGFNKTGAGGTVAFTSSNSTSTSGSTINYQNNILSNITVTGATTLIGFNNTDGGSGSAKNITGNTFSNWTGGTSSVSAINITYWSGTSTISGNTVTGLNGQAAVTGFVIGSAANGTALTVTNNQINNLTSTVTGGAVTGISSSTTTTTVTISANTIQTLSTISASTVAGIAVSGSTNNQIVGNLIYNLNATANGATINGISISAGTTSSNCRNNMIRLGVGTTAGCTINGISETGGPNNNFFNSVYIGGAPTSGSGNSYALFGSTTSAHIYYNNILFNARSNSGSTGKHYAIRNTSTTGLTSDYNVLYVTGTGGFVGLIGGVDRLGLSDWRTGSGVDLSSRSLDPQYIAPTATTPDLHISTGVPTPVEASGTGTTPAVSDDFDGQTRSGLTPVDIGADAGNFTTLSNCSGTPPAGAISGVASLCAGNTGTTLSFANGSSDLGITFLWKYSTTSGGPYTNGGTQSTFATGVLTQTTYYVVTSTCSFGGATNTSPEFTLTVNPVPTVTAGSNSPVCDGQPLNLTATSAIGTTFAWTGPNSFTNTNQNPTIAALTSAGVGTYSVTASAAGCTSTVATTAVTLNPSPTITTVTATPSTICSGSNSQLQVNAQSAYVVTSVPYTLLSGTATTISTWTAGADGTADDGFNGPIALPFSFTFNGTAYNQVWVGTNGYITFLNPSAVTGANARAASSMSSSTTPNGVIALSFADLNAISPGVVSTFTVGSPGSRVFVVDFTNVPFFTAQGGVSGQIQLFENGNAAEVHVTSVSHGTSTSLNALGIENGAGTYRLFAPGRTTAAAWNVSTSEAWRFAPEALGYSWSPATFLSSTTIANPVANTVTATTPYTVTVTGSNGCPRTGTTTVTVGSGAPPTASIAAGGPITFCAGGSVALTSTIGGGCQPYTYAWSNGVTTVATTANYTATASGNYSLTVTDNASQVVTSNAIAVTVNPIPTVTAGSNSPVCIGQPLNLTATSAIGTTFAWTGPSSYTSAVQNPIIASAVAATAGTYSVTASAAGCTSPASTTVVVVNPSPVISSVTATPSTICSGSNSQLSVTATIAPPYTMGSTGATFIDIGTTGTSVTGAIGDETEHNLTIPAFTYNGVSYTTARVGANGLLVLGSTTGEVYFSNASLPSTASTAGNIFLAPWWDDLDIDGTTAASSTIKTQTVGNKYIVQWTNMDHDALTSTSHSDLITFQIQLDLTTGAIYFVYQDVTLGSATYNAGASATVGIQFSSSSALQYSSNTASLTAGQVISFTPATLTYAWSPATFLSSATIANPVATAVTATTPYTVTVTGSNGCPATGTTTVTVGAGAAPSVSIAAGGATTFCTGGSVALTSTVTGGCQPLTYAWSDGVTTVATTANYTATASGNYTLTVTDNGSQVGTSNAIAVTVNPVPTVSASNNGPLCPGATLNLTATSAIGTTFAWTGPSSFTSAVQNPTISGVTAAAAGTYSVTASAAGCTSTAATTSVSLSAAPTITSVTATPATICTGSNSQLNVVASVALPFVRITEITLYSTGTGQTPTYPTGVTSDDLVELNNTSTVPADISGWTLIDYPSASATANRTMTFPAGSIIPANGVAVVNWGTGTNNLSTRMFYAGGTSDSWSSGTNQCVVLKNGSTIVDAVATNSATFAAGTGVTNADWSGTGASAPSTYAGTVRTGVNDTNTNADWVSSGTQTQSIGTFNPGYNNPNVGTITGYAWTPATFLSDPSIQNPVATAVTATTPYTVSVTGSNGCSSTGNVTVTVGTGAPPAVSIAAAGTTTFCAGGSVVLNSTVTDGCQPYTYAWSNGTTTVATTASYTATASGSYTLTVTDNGSQTGTSNTIVVTANPIPAVTAGSNSPVCDGQALNLTATSAIGTSFSWTGPNSFTNTNQNPTIATLTSAGVGTYSVTASAAGCTSPVSTTAVTLNVSPSISSVTATPSTICSGGNSQLNVVSSVSGYTMGSSGASFIDIGTTGTSIGTITDDNAFNVTIPSFTFNGVAYTSLRTGPNGTILFGTTTGGVNAGNAALPSTSNGSNIFLAPWWDDLDIQGTTYIKTQTVGGMFIIQYQLTHNDNTVGTVLFQVQLELATGNIYFVYQDVVFDTTVTTQNAGATATVGIQWNSTSAIQYSLNTASLTAGQVISFTPNTPSGYSWSPATFLSSTTITNPVATNVTATTTYTVTVTGSNGCVRTGTTTVTIGVPTPPTVSIAAGGPTTFCGGGSVALTSTIGGGCAPLTYAWSNGSTTVATTANYTATTSGNYTLTVTDNASQATTSNAIAVTMNPRPTATASSSPACVGQPLQLTGTTDIGTSFSWTGPNSFSSSVQNPLIASAAAANSGNYTFTATSAVGCVSATPSVLAVAVHSLPTVTSITATPPVICSGGNSQLNVVATSSGYVIGSGGAVFTDISSTGTSVGTPADETQYNITIPAFTFNGVSYTTARVGDNGVIVFGATTGSETYLNAALPSSALAAGTAFLAPFWDDLYPETGASIKTQTVGGMFIIQYTNLNHYDLSSENEVFGTDYITFQVQLELATGKIYFLYQDVSFGDSDYNAGISATVGVNMSSTLATQYSYLTGSLTNGQVISFTPAAVASYAWSPATFLNNTAIANPVASTVTATTTYTVTVTGSDGCANTATVPVTLNSGAPPTASIAAGGPTTFCAGGSVVLSSTVNDGCAPFTYSWSDGTGIVATTANYTASTNGSYTLTVTDNASNSAITNTIAVAVTPRPTASATAGSACMGGTLQLTGTTDIGATFSWTGPNSFSSTLQNPTVTNLAAANGGTYSFTATANGCTTSPPATVVVVVNNAPVINSVTADPATICSGNNSQLNAQATAVQPYVRISEVTLYSTGTGATASYPAYITGTDYVELNNTSLVAADVSGWTLSDYPSASSTARHTITFPASTIIPPNGVLVVNLGTGTNSVANRYFNTGGTSDSWFSGDAMCVALKNGTAVVDAVALNSATFAAATGVTASDWSGSAPSPGTFAGTIRTAANDSNTGADWVSSSSTTLQTIGTFNAGYNNPNTGTITGYAWSPATFLSNPSIQNPVATAVTAATTYTVTATASNGCTNTGTVTLNLSNGAPPTVGIAAGGVTTFCLGGSVVLTSSVIDGCQPFTYSWSDGTSVVATTPTYTASASGNYVLTVTDFANQVGASNTIVVNALAEPAGDRQPNAITLNNVPISLTGNNRTTSCYNNDFTTTSTPGNANAKPGRDVFYKVTTDPCTATLSIGVCASTGGDPVVHLITQFGVSLGFNDNTAPAGCANASSSSLTNIAVSPNTTYYIVVEGATAGSEFDYTLDVTQTFTGGDADGDGTPDCSDLCPFDPLKVEPGICGCGFADDDLDNDGNADCFDTCPNGPEPGQPCTDHNPATGDDIQDETCTCVGTPVATTPWSLQVVTDANGGETTWDITEDGTNDVLVSGGPFPSNTTANVVVDIPTTGLWHLNVHDSGNNGIPGGGYKLTNDAGKRVIDNTGNGGSFTTLSSSPEGFSSEVGTDQLRAIDCDNVERWPFEMIVCDPNPLVSAQWQIGNQYDDGYEFWFFNPNGGYSRHVFRNHATSGGYSPANAQRACKLGLAFASNPLPLNTLLNVRIRGRVNGTNLNWGPACRLKIDQAAANCHTTQLENVNAASFSCGVTGLKTNGSSRIWAKPVTRYIQATNTYVNANRYKFHFVNVGENTSFDIVLNSYPMLIYPQYPFQLGATYNVTVQASLDGGQTYCPVGATCQISFAATNTRMDEAAGLDNELLMWPNPNRGDQLFLRMADLDASLDKVTVDILDMYGKRVLGTTIPVGDGILNTVLQLDDQLASGLYLVNLTAGDHLVTKRLVIQR